MFRWYVVATQTTREAHVKRELEQRASRTEGIRTVMLPVDRIPEVVAGRKVVRERRIMPGYVLVEMEMRPATQMLVRRAPGVTGFVGGKAPTPMPQADVERLLRLQPDIDDKLELDVEIGETIAVAAGPFEGFEGEVVEINPDGERLKITVPIFGQRRPVEIGFDQVRLAA